MEKTVFLETVRRENEHELLIAQNNPVLVALSGGADSVALLRALLELGCTCRAAHCNFHLRGEESMRDERFVRTLCQQLGVQLTVKDFDVDSYRQMHRASVEMACRELRYAWFEQERQHQGCAVIAVAHHADDQIETFFLNLMRGTGLRGLTGMERLNGNIWRPLLTVTRADIENYLASIGQEYVTDSTNAQSIHRRNVVRNIILPFIKEHFPNLQGSILATMDNLMRDHRLMQELVMQELPDGAHIDRTALLQHEDPATLLYHRIRDKGFNHDQCVDAVTAIGEKKCGLRFLSPLHVMDINRHTIDIEPSDKQDDVIEIDLNNDLSDLGITVSSNNAPFSPLMCDGRNKVAFNNDVLNCKRIVLRHWKSGDRIKPFGMKGSKLVSDLFVDLKLDNAAKREAWLLDADGDILWVLGYRASALYTVPPESQDYLLLQLSR